MAYPAVPVIQANKNGFDNTPFEVDGAQKIDFPILRVLKDPDVSVTISPDCVTTVTMVWKRNRKKK